MMTDMVEIELATLRQERDEARAELGKAKESNGSLLAILEKLSARLTPEESASVAGEVARGARDRTQLRAERDKAREELKAAEHVGQLAARDRDNALAERNRWQDKACKLENELRDQLADNVRTLDEQLRLAGLVEQIWGALEAANTELETRRQEREEARGACDEMCAGILALAQGCSNAININAEALREVAHKPAVDRAPYLAFRQIAATRALCAPLLGLVVPDQRQEIEQALGQLEALEGALAPLSSGMEPTA